jgi:hypothetical protein
MSLHTGHLPTHYFVSSYTVEFFKTFITCFMSVPANICLLKTRGGVFEQFLDQNQPGGKLYAYKILTLKSEGNKLLGRSRCRRCDNIKMHLK